MASSVTHALPTRVGLNVRNTRECRSVNPVRIHAPRFTGGQSIPISMTKVVVSKECATAPLQSATRRNSLSARSPAVAGIYAIEPTYQWLACPRVVLESNS